jgi:hypothetical protein
MSDSKYEVILGAYSLELQNLSRQPINQFIFLTAPRYAGGTRFSWHLQAWHQFQGLFRSLLVPKSQVLDGKERNG